MIIETKFNIGDLVRVINFNTIRWEIFGIKKEKGCENQYLLYIITNDGDYKSISCCENEISLCEENKIGFNV